MKKHSLLTLLAAGSLLAGTASALAAEPDQADTVPMPERILVVEFASEVVDDAELDTVRGQFGFFLLREVVEHSIFKFNLFLAHIRELEGLHTVNNLNANECGECISVAPD